MRVRIHRGAAEVGGSCVELESGGQQLVLDLGRPLWAGPNEAVPLPPIDGLSTGEDSSLLGVILSHGHLDHYGLIDQVDRSVPLFAGQATARILKEAAFFSPAGLGCQWAGYFGDREPMQLGPFTVTPYLVDHSAFDAYAVLVEADGKRVFYSGDLRAHGLGGEAFERLVSDPPSAVDVLLLEGTRVGTAHSDGRPLVTEAELENRFEAVIRATEGLVLVAYSAQNIDRLRTLYRATMRTAAGPRPRQLVIDPYIDAMARATGDAGVPRAETEGVKTYVPQSMRVKIKRSGEFHRIDKARRHRLFPEELRDHRNGLVMSFRPSMARELERVGCLEGAHLIWSMWPGYLEDERLDQFHTLLDRHGIGLTTIHASGHATETDLQRLADAIDPDRVVPIHTSAPERYPEVFQRVELHPDGEIWSACVEA